jgi:hypothetical protein
MRRRIAKGLMVLLTPLTLLLLLISAACIAINYGAVALVRMIEK